MTFAEVMAALEALGTEQTRKTFARHGMPPGSYGVRIGDLKVLQKKIKVDHGLALDLYATGNSDAMYLAALIADDARMTKKDLQDWADGATWYMHSEYSVPWVAASSPHAWAMALKWIDSKKEPVAAAGWATLSTFLGITPDEDLDLPGLGKLLDRVTKTIHAQPNRVRYTMNGFVIAAGGFVIPLTARALAAAKLIGPVACDMGETACKVPDATAYLKKMQAGGHIGKKRKMAKC